MRYNQFQACIEVKLSTHVGFNLYDYDRTGDHDRLGRFGTMWFTRSKFYSLYARYISLSVLCFHFFFGYLCGCVYMAFILYSLNWLDDWFYRVARVLSIHLRESKKFANHLSTKQFIVQIVLSSFHITLSIVSNHWWKIPFCFEQIISMAYWSLTSHSALTRFCYSI